MRILAARTGQLINYSDISKDIDISVNTVKAWISILETSGLIFLLQPYYNNITNRIIKTPKLYFFDTGLACYLTGWDSAKVLENGAMSGALLETYIISEIIKSYWHNGERGQFYFYRDKEKQEIDLLIERGGIVYPIEIKRTASPNLHDAKHFKALSSLRLKIGTGAVICLTDNIIPLSHDIAAIPINYLG
jgi:predicted AAA+ superfamily ATPase